MGRPNWTLKMTTNPNNGSLDFQIVDNHHAGEFYGEWNSKDEEELSYHLDGLKECIDRGTYANNEMYINDERMSTWTEFNQKAHYFYHNHPNKDVA